MDDKQQARSDPDLGDRITHLVADPARLLGIKGFSIQ